MQWEILGFKVLKIFFIGTGKLKISLLGIGIRINCSRGIDVVIRKGVVHFLIEFEFIWVKSGIIFRENKSLKFK
jgi:hypothetical protein